MFVSFVYIFIICFSNEILYINLWEKTDVCIVFKEVFKNNALDIQNQRKKVNIIFYDHAKYKNILVLWSVLEENFYLKWIILY